MAGGLRMQAGASSKAPVEAQFWSFSSSLQTYVFGGFASMAPPVGLGVGLGLRSVVELVAKLAVCATTMSAGECAGIGLRF